MDSIDITCRTKAVRNQLAICLEADGAFEGFNVYKTGGDHNASLTLYPANRRKVTKAEQRRLIAAAKRHFPDDVA